MGLGEMLLLRDLEEGKGVLDFFVSCADRLSHLVSHLLRLRISSSLPLGGGSLFKSFPPPCKTNHAPFDSAEASRYDTPFPYIPRPMIE